MDGGKSRKLVIELGISGPAFASGGKWFWNTLLCNMAGSDVIPVNINGRGKNIPSPQEIPAPDTSGSTIGSNSMYASKSDLVLY